MEREPCSTPLARAEPGWVARGEYATGHDMLAVTSLTPRQLDHWTRRGYLVVVHEHPGSGYRHYWDAAEQRIAHAMCRLVHAGVEVQFAADIARRAVEEGKPEWTRNGVTISVTVPEW